jgi:hypothetical protein
LQRGYHLLWLLVAAAHALSLVAVSLRRGRAVDVAAPVAAR